MTTTAERIAELTAEWEEGANYGEAEPTHRAADYALSEDDWAVYLGTEGAAEIVALIQRRDDDQEKAEQIARQIVGGSNWIQSEDRAEFLDVATAAALTALTEKEDQK